MQSSARGAPVISLGFISLHALTQLFTLMLLLLV
jgi:hypothetical protein